MQKITSRFNTDIASTIDSINADSVYFKYIKDEMKLLYAAKCLQHLHNMEYISLS